MATNDPFASDFSQARVEAPTTTFPVVQWLGTTTGPAGWFMDGDNLLSLGVTNPREVAPGFEYATPYLGGKPVEGWIARELSFAFVLTHFCWENREDGRPVPAGMYNELKQRGEHRSLRGRTRCLVGVKELFDFGFEAPVMLTVRASYSAAVNAILRDAKRMADEATRLRRQAGHEGGIPREAFWVPVFTGEPERVGQPGQQSTIIKPVANIPEALDRNFLVRHLVEEAYRRPGGLFDQWADLYGPAWEERMGAGDDEGADEESPPANGNGDADLTGWSNGGTHDIAWARAIVARYIELAEENQDDPLDAAGIPQRANSKLVEQLKEALARCGANVTDDRTIPFALRMLVPQAEPIGRDGQITHVHAIALLSALQGQQGKDVVEAVVKAARGR